MVYNLRSTRSHAAEDEVSSHHGVISSIDTASIAYSSCSLCLARSSGAIHSSSSIYSGGSTPGCYCFLTFANYDDSAGSSLTYSKSSSTDCSFGPSLNSNSTSCWTCSRRTSPTLVIFQLHGACQSGRGANDFRQKSRCRSSSATQERNNFFISHLLKF